VRFVLIFGPPAVGKMTVGHELAKRTGFKLFHNHMTVEPVLDIFEFGSPPFDRLVGEFRRRVIEEAVAAEMPGLVFTLVWGLELASDLEIVTSYANIVEDGGGTVHFVALYAERDERLARNGTAFRLEQKRSKRDLEFSRQNLLALDEQFVMNSGTVPTPAAVLWEDREYLRLDNTNLPAPDAAERIMKRFGFAQF
jgi:hypothetical protein